MNLFFQLLVKFIYKQEEYVDSAGRISAMASFSIGTLLLLGFTILEIEALIPIGFLFVVFCIIINLLILSILIFKMCIKIYKHQSLFAHFITLITLLINVPITIGYLYIVVNYSYN